MFKAIDLIILRKLSMSLDGIYLKNRRTAPFFYELEEVTDIAEKFLELVVM